MTNSAGKEGDHRRSGDPTGRLDEDVHAPSVTRKIESDDGDFVAGLRSSGLPGASDMQQLERARQYCTGAAQ
jgi:hypothetical protein